MEQRVAIHFDRYGMMRVVTERPSQVYIVDERESESEDKIRRLKNTHVSFVGAVARLLAGRPVLEESAAG